METWLGNALGLSGVQHVADLAFCQVKLADALFAVALTIGAGLPLSHTCTVCVAGCDVPLWTGLDAAEVREEVIRLADRAVLSRVLTLCAAGGTLSADSILGKRQPYLSCANWAVHEALLGCLNHLQALSALEANLRVVSCASKAVVGTQVTRAALLLVIDCICSRNRDTCRALIYASMREVGQELVSGARGTVVRGVRRACLAVFIALNAAPFVVDGDVRRARPVTLIAEEVAEWLRQVAAGASGLAAFARLARRYTRLAGLRVIDAMVRVGTDVHALVTQEVHPKVTFEALFASLVALEAASVALGANAIDLVVVAGAIIPARAIKEERQGALGPRVTLEAPAWLANWALPAGPVTGGRDGQATHQLVYKVAIFGHRQHSEGISWLGNVPVVQTFQLDINSGASPQLAVGVDIFQQEGVGCSIELALDVAGEWRAVHPAG